MGEDRTVPLSESPMPPLARLIAPIAVGLIALTPPPPEARAQTTFGASCDAPAQQCAAAVPPECTLEALGAGAVPATEGCADVLSVYRQCLSDVVARCGQPAASSGADAEHAALPPETMLSPGMLECRGAGCAPRAGMFMTYGQDGPVSFANANAVIFSAENGLTLVEDLSPQFDRFTADQAQIPVSQPLPPGLYVTCVTYQRPGEAGTWTLVRAHRVRVMSENVIGPMRLMMLNGEHVLSPDAAPAPDGDCRAAAQAFAARNDLL